MAVLNADHLLDQADRLVPAGKAPRQADLRRAISTAYYAVFHEVVTAAADDLIGKTQRDTARYALVYRSIDHRSLKDLASDVAKTNLPGKYLKYEPRGGFGPEIQAVAAAIVDLQEKRHGADYDPLLRVKRSDAVSAVASARAALVRFRGASAARRRVFLSLLIFPPRRES